MGLGSKVEISHGLSGRNCTNQKKVGIEIKNIEHFHIDLIAK